MGNFKPHLVKLEFEPDEFYALQSIIEQWYAEHHLDEGYYTKLKNQVANEIRQTTLCEINGSVIIE